MSAHEYTNLQLRKFNRLPLQRQKGNGRRMNRLLGTFSQGPLADFHNTIQDTLLHIGRHPINLFGNSRLHFKINAGC